MATQDMPPPGGFATINIERTLPKPILRQGIWYAIAVGLTFNGYFVIREWKKKQIILRTELAEDYVATCPFLYAEQERRFLRHIKNVRERERELMKDHPNWKLGTLYGEPVFKTVPKDQIPPIDPNYFGNFNRDDDWILEHQIPDINR